MIEQSTLSKTRILTKIKKETYFEKLILQNLSKKIPQNFTKYKCHKIFRICTKFQGSTSGDSRRKENMTLIKSYSHDHAVVIIC